MKGACSRPQGYLARDMGVLCREQRATGARPFPESVRSWLIVLVEAQRYILEENAT